MMLESRSTMTSRRALPLLKSKAGSSSIVTMQSEGVAWFATHWSRRQLLCGGEACPGCDQLSTRARGYFIATIESAGDRLPILVEMSSPSWDRVESMSKMLGIAIQPGRKLEISRRTKKSPLKIELMEETEDPESYLIPLRKAASAVAILHKISPPDDDETLAHWSARTLPQCCRIIEEALAKKSI